MKQDLNPRAENNILHLLDYPKGHLKIIIACDGCADDTAALALKTAKETECEYLDIEVREFVKNRGKE